MPDVCVIVATARALKYNGGMDKNDLSTPNLSALEQGLPNLLKHIDNLQSVFGLSVVVAINQFASDSIEELALIENKCREYGVTACLSDVWAKGGTGGQILAQAVLDAIAKNDSSFKFAYNLDESIADKIHSVASKIYSAKAVNFSADALSSIKRLEKLGLDKLPICMAKTQYSLSDNPKLLGHPKNFDINVRDVIVANGAGFIVVICGTIMKMPGLPKTPAAERIDVINGEIVGLF